MTPFWANYQYHPPMEFKSRKAPSNMRSEILPDGTVLGMEQTRWLHRKGLLEAQARRTKYAGGKDVTFEVGIKVLLST
jgi:hypothetical protein